jgi:hypothetical protein
LRLGPDSSAGLPLAVVSRLEKLPPEKNPRVLPRGKVYPAPALRAPLVKRGKD